MSSSRNVRRLHVGCRDSKGGTCNAPDAIVFNNRSISQQRTDRDIKNIGPNGFIKTVRNNKFLCKSSSRGLFLDDRGLASIASGRFADEKLFK